MANEQNSAGLIESLRHEQRRRWAAGDKVTVEVYLRQNSELASDADSLLELVYNEILLRESSGLLPSLAEYQERFPQMAAGLETLFAVHAILDDTDEAGNVPTMSPASAPPARGNLPTITGFEVLREIGRGGMSVVYEARQLGVNRPVALKMLLAGCYAGPEQRTRFRTEAEALGRLHHPHIVPVHDVGEQDGRPYLVMEYIAGGSLADALVAGKWGTGNNDAQKASAHLIATLANAVHSAHERGIVHRDLKPANVLFQSTAGNLQSAIPKITDFGLAKLLEDDPQTAGRMTQSGAILGTPAYMAPEQAAGQTRDVGPAADIYALGAMLYELLAGRPPFRANTPLETLFQVQTLDAPSPNRYGCRLPRDLVTICLHCLEKDPGRRYPSAGSLAQDLGRFLAGEPVRARPVGFIGRAWRWCKRKPLVASLAAVLFMMVVGSVASLAGLYLRAREREAKALQSEAETKAVLEFFERRILAAPGPKGQGGKTGQGSGLGHDATIRDAVDQAEPAIAGAFGGQPLAEASIRQTLGQTYWYRGAYARAITQHEQALALRRQQLGSHHPDTLKSMSSLAQDYFADGRYAEAIRLEEEMVPLCETYLGPEDAETLWCMHIRAKALGFAGRAQEALPLHEETLRRAKKSQPDSHDTLIYMDSLGVAYLYATRLPEALTLLETTLHLERTRLGPKHPDTLITMDYLGQAHLQAGQVAEAIKLFREALNIRKEVLEPDHFETLISMNNLAMSYCDDGLPAEALPLMEEVVKRRTARQGPDHDATLIAKGNLARVYQELGRWDEALVLYEAVIDKQKRNQGSAYPRRLTFMNREAACLLQMKRFRQAEALLRDCLVLRVQQDADDWWVFQTKSQLGQALLGLQRYAEAEPLLLEAQRELIARKTKIPVPYHRSIAEVSSALENLSRVWHRPQRDQPK